MSKSVKTGTTILVVEDEPNDLARIQGILKKGGYQVGGHKSLAMAERRLKVSPPDLVILDIRLSGESGYEVCRSLKANDITRNIPVLFVSQLTDTDSKVQAFRAGGVDYITKPFQEEEVLARVECHLSLRRLQRELEETNNALMTKHEALRRYFDPALFELLESKPELLRAREAELSVSFWDIRGFSALCKTFEAHPDVIVDFLKSYSEEAARVIFRNGGMLDKFIGDGVMALFGLHLGESKQSEAAQDAVSAALEIQGRFRILLGESKGRWRRKTAEKVPDIGLGCGVHTGKVIVGNVGTTFRDQFTALGTEVNLAARICGKALAGKVWISQSTAELVKDRLRLSPLPGDHNLKNIRGEYSLFVVEGDG